MNKKLAAATTAIALSLSATQAYARCDDVFSAYGPGTDESVALAACFVDKAKNQLDESALFDAFLECAAQATGEDPAITQDMSEADFSDFMDEHFHRWTFEHEMECHAAKLQEDPYYDPLTAMPN